MTDRLVAVDDANYRLPQPVRAALSLEASDADTELGGELAATFPSRAALGITVPDGDGLSFTSLQAAADDAATNGTMVWAAGTITTNQTLVLTSDANLGGVTINYTGTGVAVQIGSGTSGALVLRKKIGLPRVFNASKVGAGWTGSTVGVRVINANTCEIDVPHVQGFVTGLNVTDRVKARCTTRSRWATSTTTRSTCAWTLTQPAGRIRTCT
ncbi:hypothetical protein [Microbacterium sp. K24]|uniref:hypothetical protein n=1 Tax=Microbacterium sp. K24 TaxID=2305446 RepID=UPI00109D60F8|nr:hypothetical protein [Microbacterium sp. K24]